MIEDTQRYIFGAGILGNRFVNLCLDYRIPVDGIVDNNYKIWNTEVRGVFIQSPDVLKCFSKGNIQIFICCKQAEDIITQIKSYGICAKDIILCNTAVLMMKAVMSIWDKRKPMILFGLDNGLTLGGVESWSMQTAKFLEKQGYDYRFLLPSDKNEDVSYDSKYLAKVDYSELCKANNDDILEMMGKHLPCVLVTNFIGSNFLSACLAKKQFKDEVKHICVIHSDDEVYYTNYFLMERYIDDCLVVSEQIYHKICEMHFPQKKLSHLIWEIPCQESFFHVYSKKGEKLCIGYAGRITIAQKRVDLLLQVLIRLLKNNVSFCIDIAGIGDDRESLQKIIQQEGLTDCVCFRGLLDRRELPQFWKEKDIMISCSDIEGHSITQCEAMAAGAVPILTDVSGVRDDVVDGENGFIVNTGDVDGFVEKISYLAVHRERLPIMGRKAYETIKNKYTQENVVELWRSILEK